MVLKEVQLPCLPIVALRTMHKHVMEKQINSIGLMTKQ